jgi:hypothetical protein
MWCAEHGQEKIQKELSINKKNVVYWCLRIRENIADHISTEGNVIEGDDENGNFLDVEIDESLCFKRMYNRGRVGNPKWVFGGIKRKSGKCFFVPVENRSAGVLLIIIYEKFKMAPG